jgi:hypothetical protein
MADVHVLGGPAHAVPTAGVPHPDGGYIVPAEQFPALAAYGFYDADRPSHPDDNPRPLARETVLAEIKKALGGADNPHLLAFNDLLTELRRKGWLDQESEDDPHHCGKFEERASVYDGPGLVFHLRRGAHLSVFANAFSFWVRFDRSWSERAGGFGERRYCDRAIDAVRLMDDLRAAWERDDG